MRPPLPAGPAAVNDVPAPVALLAVPAAAMAAMIFLWVRLAADVLTNPAALLSGA